MNYQTIRLDKSMYRGAAPFSSQLEKLDPSNNYKGTDLAGLDAFQRQLKRFDIHVSGSDSDTISKFFSTGDSAALFPEYVQRAVMQGADESEVINRVIASKTVINSMDYRTITTDSGSDLEAAVLAEGAQIPKTVIKLKDNLVHLTKRGRMLVASYEAIKFQRIDLFTVTLKQIGTYITRAQLKDAVKVLMDGDSENDKNKAEVITTKTAGELTYDDLLNLWSKFEEFKMNTWIVSPDMMQKLLAISELRDPNAGLNFSGSGRIGTPFGANVIKSSAVPEGTIVALDKDFALEMVTAGDITVDYDKLIDTQFERAAVTSISGFAKIFPDAVKVLKLKAE